MKTLILGNTGMLGSMVTKTWEGDFISLGRDEANLIGDIYEQVSKVWRPNQASQGYLDYTINCVGVIKPYCNDVQNAIKVNALAPHRLQDPYFGCVIQIATDCVYSGKKGNYVESDPHDALDVYGKTKSLGEAPHVKNLRCSIIGPEIKNHASLLDWFLSQEKANGFTNHLWNGITTYHFSKIVQGVIKERIELPNVQHIVPADTVTKAELLKIIAGVYGKDIPVTEVEADEPVDRTLATNNPELNLRIWKAAGYDKPPTVRQMVEELASLK